MSWPKFTVRSQREACGAEIAAGRLRAMKLVPGLGSSRVLIPRSSIEQLLAAALGEGR